MADHIAKAAHSNQLVVNHLSGAVGMKPRHLAGIVNESAYKSIGLYAGKRKLGVLVMDYPGDRLIYRIVKSNLVSGAATECAAKEYRTDSVASYAIFKLPGSQVGHKISFKGGAYNHYVFPRGCNRVTWTDLQFA